MWQENLFLHLKDYSMHKSIELLVLHVINNIIEAQETLKYVIT